MNFDKWFFHFKWIQLFNYHCFLKWKMVFTIVYHPKSVYRCVPKESYRRAGQMASRNILQSCAFRNMASPERIWECIIGTHSWNVLGNAFLDSEEIAVTIFHLKKKKCSKSIWSNCRNAFKWKKLKWSYFFCVTFKCSSSAIWQQFWLRQAWAFIWLTNYFLES